MDLVLIIALVVLVLLGMVGFTLWHRTASDPSESVDAAVVSSTQASQQGVSEQGALLVPLPTARDEALALGSEQQLAALEMAGLIHPTSTPSRGPLPQVIRTVITAGGNEANRRASQGVESGRIVALSKETMQQLEKNKAGRDKGGNMLGLVRGKKGRIAHVMRLDQAGAKAIVASNAATLAMTAAVSQQLEHIEQQLTEIRETLDEMMEDAEIQHVADAMGTNHELDSIARDIRRRGYMTQADQNNLANLSLEVTQNALEADLKVTKLLSGTNTELGRANRVAQLDRLLDNKRLEYWLALRVETELAYTRRELLRLYWEQSQHPEAARSLADEVRNSIGARQERMKQLGALLDELSNPESRRRLDPLRQISRRKLTKRDHLIEQLLAKHGDAFAGPEMDPYAVVDSGAEEVLVLSPGNEGLAAEAP